MSAPTRQIENTVREFFTSYVAAFNAKDAAGTARHLALPCFNLSYADGDAQYHLIESSTLAEEFFDAQIDRLRELGWDGTSTVLRTDVTLFSPATASLLADYERRTVSGEFIEAGRVAYTLMARDEQWGICGYAHIQPGYAGDDSD